MRDGARGQEARARLLRLGLFVLPSVVVMLVRLSWFGAVTPLSLTAKQPDLTSGLRYLLGSALLCGPLLLLWPFGLGRTEGARRWVPVFLAHGACVLLAGGDWMPLYRLWVPTLPWLVAVCVREWKSSRVGYATLAVMAMVSGLYLTTWGESTRAVVARRSWMVEALRPHLAVKNVVAAVDIGWVGRATRATVVDLAGVTDPRVAALPGGHTSKLITPGFFAARSVDTWIVRAVDRAYQPGAPLDLLHAVYAVDRRLLRRVDDLGFEAAFVIPLPHTDEQYVVLRHAGGRD